MRAVNLMPGGSSRRTVSGISVGELGPVHVLLGVLVVVLAYVTVYVLTDNTISQRKSQLAALHVQLSQEQAVTAGLKSYTQFAQLAQQRAETVRQIADGRFDWHGALTDLSKVMPADASLQSLVATTGSGASGSGAGASSSSAGGGAGGLIGALGGPAFEIKGCTASQDDVARLISRLRLINGVQRVTLANSAKSANGLGSVTSTSSSSSSASGLGGCSGNSPSFDIVVFFQALPGTSSGGTSGSTSPATPAGASAAASQASTQASGGSK